MHHKKKFAFNPFFFLLLFTPFKELQAQRATATSNMGTTSPLNYILYSNGGSPSSLEAIEGRIRPRPKLLGFADAEYVIEGERSPIRIKSADTLHFTIHTSPMADPLRIVKLYRFDAQKGSRQAIAYKAGSFSTFGNKKSKNGKNEIAFRIQKTGTDVYQISTTNKLLPGEYGFMNSMLLHGTSVNNSTYTFLAFGVDE